MHVYISRCNDDFPNQNITTIREHINYTEKLNRKSCDRPCKSGYVFDNSFWTATIITGIVQQTLNGLKSYIDENVFSKFQNLISFANILS